MMILNKGYWKIQGETPGIVCGPSFSRRVYFIPLYVFFLFFFFNHRVLDWDWVIQPPHFAKESIPQ